MRTLTVFLFALISNVLLSQSVDFDTLLHQGKKEFYKDFDKQDFENAVDKLEHAVMLNPDNAEAHYFLGYAYSRLNSKDGKGMIDMSLQLTLKSSEQFEIVKELTPKYQGEILILDPYSKLTAEWGSLAMSYWFNNEPDSAIWAFQEGKKRGGFGEFYLSINRKALDFCTKDAILISSGDNFTIPLWYLQIVENYRTDVSVVDISLLNSIWYPRFLVANSNISFGVSDQELDSIKYVQWSDSTITLDISSDNHFSWTVKPSFYDNFLLRGDRLFLGLLQDNLFKREVFFTTAFIEDSRLSLNKNLSSLILIDRINYDQKPKMLFKDYKAKISSIIDCLSNLNPNSQQEEYFVDNIRLDMFVWIHDYLNNGDRKQAKILIRIIDKRVDPKVYPFQSEQVQKYYEYLKQRI